MVSEDSSVLFAHMHVVEAVECFSDSETFLLIDVPSKNRLLNSPEIKASRAYDFLLDRFQKLFRFTLSDYRGLVNFT